MDLDRAKKIYTDQHRVESRIPPAVAEFIIENTCIEKKSNIILMGGSSGRFLDLINKTGCKNLTYITENPYNNQDINEFPGIFYYSGNPLDKVSFIEYIFDEYYHVAIGEPLIKEELVKEERILREYELGKQETVEEALYLERFTQLLKPGGKLRIILPSRIFFHGRFQEVRDFIISRLKIEALAEFTAENGEKKIILLGIKDKKNQWEKVGLFKIGENMEQKRGDSSSPSIKDFSWGIEKNIEDIRARMSPGYHLLYHKIKEKIKRAKVKFISINEIGEVIEADNCQNGNCHKGDIIIFTTQGQKQLQEDKIIYLNENLLSDENPLQRLSSPISDNTLPVLTDESLTRCGFVIRIKSPLFKRGFVALYLNTTLGREYIQKEKEAEETLTPTRLKNIRIPLLTLSQQEELYNRFLHNPLPEEIENKMNEMIF